MEKRVDEKILDFLIEAQKRKARKNICNGPVKIENKYYHFLEKCFFDEKLKIYIPKDFMDIPCEERKLKYPLESEPEIIKSNDDGSVVITLNIIDNPLNEERVEELKDGMKIVIKKTNPANIFYEDGILEVDSKNIGFFEFKSYNEDDSIYNLIFLLEFKEKTLMGTFNCRYKKYEEWRDIAFQVIKTIKVLK